MLPKTDTRDGGLRGRLRVVYYHFGATGTFPTPSQCSGGEHASENLVLCHERQCGDRVGEETGAPEEKRAWMLSRVGDFCRNGDGEVGGKGRKRKSGLIMRVGVSGFELSG
jgi:hypothetical protein